MTTPSSARANRRDFLKLAGVIAAAGTFAGTLAACGKNPNLRNDGGGASASASANNDGTITAAISYELGTNGFDPMTTSSALTVAANWHTMEGLTELETTGDRKAYAALASDLPKKIDDTHYEATLRDGAKFHDGSPVTTDDVVYSFARVLDPANKSMYVQFLTFLDHVEKKDDKTVTIVTKYPFSLVPERLAVVKIVPQKLVTADPKAFDAKPTGTGAYKLTDNSAASKQLVFERFADYTGKRPAKAAKMVWLVTPDATTRTNALQSGSAQAIDSVPYLSMDSLKASRTVEAVQGFNLAFAMFNCGSAPFSDPRNRQAVLYAFDMDKVISTAFLGNASKVTCFVPENHPAYKRATVVYDHDVAKAKDLFAQTGLTKVRMLCTNHDWVKLFTPILKESLEAAGLTVDFTEKQSSDVYNTIDGKPDAYDMVIAPGDPSVFGYDADLLLRWWYSGDTWTNARMHWKGQDSYTQLQSLMDAAVRQSGDEQKKTWGQTFDLLSQAVPLYPLFHRKTPSAWDSNTLVNFKPISETGLSFIDVASTK